MIFHMREMLAGRGRGRCQRRPVLCGPHYYDIIPGPGKKINPPHREVLGLPLDHDP